MSNVLSVSTIVFWILILGFNTAFSATENISSQKNELNLLLEKVIKDKLFEDFVWLRLLHFRVTPKVAKHSDIVSPDFFLAYDKNHILTNESGTRHITPKQELYATLKAFYEPVTKDQNLHPQCRFPARFLWLDKKLSFSKKKLFKVNCARLNEWAKFESLDSLSLIMVSGYFGNPASTFGHLLLKLNNSEFKSSSGNLLDQSINYGAKVPENESIPVYIAKGIFGGYASRFSNKEFYSQDLVYSKQEYRDMWEYELNLNAYQNRLLVFHVWEMLGMESDYYFLKENCGYRIAELLELVTGKQLTPDKQAWYLPISVFQELEDINNSQYIKKITFLPSSQRKLYHGFDQLNNDEQKVINQLLRKKSVNNISSIKIFTAARQSRIAELMIEYYQYKLSAEDNDVNNKITNQYTYLKNRWVLERLKLPSGSRSKQIPQIINMISPAKSEKSLLFQIGIAHNQERGTLLEIGLTGIHYDLLSSSYGSLENIELKAFDLLINIDEKQNVNLTKFDVISVFKLGLNSTKLYGEESNRSWRIKTGFKQNGLSCKHCTNFYAQGGLGLTYKLSAISQNLIVYGMLDAEYHADNNGIDIRPNIGLLMSQGNKLKSILEFGSNKNIGSGDNDMRLKFESRYSFSKNNSFRMSYEKDRGEQLKASFYHNW